MKKLISIMLLAFSLGAVAQQRFILKNGDEWSYKRYPRADYANIENLENGLTWYADSIGAIPVYDSRIYRVKDTTIFTEDYHHVYTNLLKSVTTYSLEQLTYEEILINIGFSVEDHINEAYSNRDAIADIYRYIELDISPGNPPSERDEIDSIFNRLGWQQNTRKRGKHKKDSLVNLDIIPDFNYPQNPITE